MRGEVNPFYKYEGGNVHALDALFFVYVTQ